MGVINIYSSWGGCISLGKGIGRVSKVLRVFRLEGKKMRKVIIIR